MLFTKATLDGLVSSEVTSTYRRWTVVRPRVGSTFTTRVGVVRVDGIEPVEEDQLTDDDARAAGYPSVVALRRWLLRTGDGDLYRIDISLAGPDPRVALRVDSELTLADRAAIDRRLDRMDAAADRPWTRRTLGQIAERPGTVSTALAAAVGEERQAYKLRVRRLKALGLTESLEVGYRLSPRGQSYLGQSSEP